VILIVTPEAMTASGIDELIAAEREVVVPVPPVFTYEGWEDWEKAIINYLSSKRGTRGTPLEYVIRNDVTFQMPDACRYDQLVYGAPLVGMAFDNDKLMVHKILLPFGDRHGCRAVDVKSKVWWKV